MPIFTITHTERATGNSFSRPVVAATEGDALNEREAELGIDDAEAEGWTVKVWVQADPNGARERRMVASEQKLRHDELCRW